MSWRAAASCRGSDTDLFFRMDGERGAAVEQREEQAKAICSGCPVTAACLADAQRRPEVYGTFGGLNEDERKNERRRRQRRDLAERRGEQQDEQVA